MIKSLICYLFMLMISVSGAYPQYRGFTDRFEDGSMELARRGRNRDSGPVVVWHTLTAKTYGLEESNGVLSIQYTREAGIGAFDRFTLTPPFPVNVVHNPHIRLRIKSTTGMVLTLQPVYSLKPPTYEEIKQDIPGDNEWHTYTFKLYDFLYERFSVQCIDFYFDKGSQTGKQGTVLLDDVRIGWNFIEVTDQEVEILNGTDVKLSWSVRDPESVGAFRVYRDTIPRFETSERNFFGETMIPEFTDESPGSYELYYYRVIPVDKDGEESLPSPEIRAETYVPGRLPGVSVAGTNSGTIKKYEKFEILLDLVNVGIHNPYDPEDIDVYALFISPENKTIRINGFYDNYRNADTWKIRFSPNQTGIWSYEIFVKDAGGTGKTEKSTFTVVPSDHHGWIKPSTKNPHYFVNDDGTSYYAVGVYSPWRNTEERFQTFAAHDANFFAIWDIMYGGFVNETGIIEEELGRYNQEKLGRIDSLLKILETSDIKLMYAIWPHDLFSKTVWAAQWEQNPYSKIVDVVDVYRDELTWQYQMKKYRYLIARFAHSRSMGIWELINEMNGTDGWKEARYDEAYAWVKKADKFFEENDPYNHPVTASFSGGYDEYREPLYDRIDVPNIHVYPAQGWPVQYPGDTLRSSMYNYAWASRRFWNNFEKPAIFGEAGADLAYYENDDPEYHEAYHNAIWATLTNGLAGIPVWWEYHHLNDQDWDQLHHLADFVVDIDFGNVDYHIAEISGKGIDAFAMISPGKGFGWARIYEGIDISQALMRIVTGEGKYRISWFDTWDGKTLDSTITEAGSDGLLLKVPGMTEKRKDVAFKIELLK